MKPRACRAFFACASMATSCVAACGWNPSRPFDREAPAVVQAIRDLDAGDAQSAARRLEDYLSTGECQDGNIGTPELARRADGTFDLGLSLFRLGEQFGRRFGEEEAKANENEGLHAKRHAQVLCAKRLVQTIATAPETAIDLRARARYLDGNLAFLDGEYEEAVRSYDAGLLLAPGDGDGGDSVGRDIAWNRAIALRRIEDKKDAGPDASGDAAQDSATEGGRDAGRDAGGDGSGDNGRDGASSSPDGGRDAGQDASPPKSEPPDGGAEQPEAGAKPPPTSPNEDERMLDQLESAPTLQQEEAKRFGKKRVRGMADK
jgi:hypothetical protein